MFPFAIIKTEFSFNYSPLYARIEQTWNSLQKPFKSSRILFVEMKSFYSLTRTIYRQLWKFFAKKLFQLSIKSGKSLDLWKIAKKNHCHEKTARHFDFFQEYSQSIRTEANYAEIYPTISIIRHMYAFEWLGEVCGVYFGMGRAIAGSNNVMCNSRAENIKSKWLFSVKCR